MIAWIEVLVVDASGTLAFTVKPNDRGVNCHDTLEKESHC